MSLYINVTPGSLKEAQILQEATKLKLEVTQTLLEKLKHEYNQVGDGYKAIVDVLIELKKKHVTVDRETFDRHFEMITGTDLGNKSEMGGLFRDSRAYSNVVDQLVGK